MLKAKDEELVPEQNQKESKASLEVEPSRESIAMSSQFRHQITLNERSYEKIVEKIKAADWGPELLNAPKTVIV